MKEETTKRFSLSSKARKKFTRDVEFWLAIGVLTAPAIYLLNDTLTGDKNIKAGVISVSVVLLIKFISERK